MRECVKTMENTKFDYNGFAQKLEAKFRKETEQVLADRFLNKCQGFNDYLNLLAECQRCKYDKTHPIVIACVYKLFDMIRCSGLADKTVDVKKLLDE